ncbi:MAG: hypothetical protein R3322_00175 [Kiloniellales bacterium]|nr:hypothetical protein [Kiloniellales bacterium]
MATTGVNLPLPAGNGVGSAASVAALGIVKSFVFSAAEFVGGTVTIEISNNGGPWCQAASFTRPGVQVLPVACTDMRVRVANLRSGAVDAISVQGEAASVSTASLPVPAGPGVGASVNVEPISSEFTVLVANNATRYTGTIAVEISQDNANFETASPSFADPGGCSTEVAPARFARVVRTGLGGTPDVSIASAEVSGGGGGGGSLDDAYNVGRFIFVDAGPVDLQTNNFQLGTTPALQIVNNTASDAVATEQRAGSYFTLGSAWDGSTSQNISMDIQLRPQSGRAGDPNIAMGGIAFTTNGPLAQGGPTPFTVLEIGDYEIVNLENTGGPNPQTIPVRIAQNAHPPPANTFRQFESAAWYCKVDPNPGPGGLQPWALYLEITDNQADATAGGGCKVIHFGHGDAWDTILFGFGAVGYEAATFVDSTRGFIGTIQRDTMNVPLSLPNSVHFIGLWESTTVPNFAGCMLAQEQVGNAITIQKLSNALGGPPPDGQEQMRLVENDYARSRYSLFNDGAVRLSPLVTDGVTTERNSPRFSLIGSSWDGAANEDLGAVLTHVVTASGATPQHDLRFLIGPQFGESVAMLINGPNASSPLSLDLQTHAMLNASLIQMQAGGDIDLQGGDVLNPATITMQAGGDVDLQGGDLLNVRGEAFLDGSAFGAAPANTGRLVFNATDQNFQVSENGGAYTPIARWAIQNFFTADQVLTAIDADAGSQLRDSPQLALRATYWTGAASANFDSTLVNNVTATTPTGQVEMRINGALEYAFGQTTLNLQGNGMSFVNGLTMSVGANLDMQTGDILSVGTVEGTNNPAGAGADIRILAGDAGGGGPDDGGDVIIIPGDEDGGGTPGSFIVRDAQDLGTLFETNDTGIAFFGGAPVAQPSVTGSRGGNAALTSLLTALAAGSLNLITDNTTA